MHHIDVFNTLNKMRGSVERVQRAVDQLCREVEENPERLANELNEIVEIYESDKARGFNPENLDNGDY